MARLSCARWLAPAVLGSLAAATLFAPAVSSAATTTWNLGGRILSRDFSIAPGQDIPIAPGDTFSFSLTLDPATQGINTSVVPCSTTRCQYNIASLSVTNFLLNGSSVGEPGVLNAPWFRLFSGYTGPGNCPGPDGSLLASGGSCDAYFIRGFSQGRDSDTSPIYYETWSFFFGSATLDWVSGDASNRTSVPTNLPPLSQLRMAEFNYCRLSVENGTTCNLAFINGRFEPNFVPEPGTFALLGLGLVGLGAARRRRLS